MHGGGGKREGRLSGVFGPRPQGGFDGAHEGEHDVLTPRARRHLRPHRQPGAAPVYLARRLAYVAQDVEIFAREGGFSAAITTVRERTGRAAGHAARKRRPLPAGLTAREVEVLRLVAQGCSNKEIARALVITEKTAVHHIQHVYDKIGVSTRGAAALFAVQQDLLPDVATDSE